MLFAASEEIAMYPSPGHHSGILVLDIETLDSKPLQLWDEPIISFSVSLPTKSISSWEAPTACFTAENPEEEHRLLLLLRNLLWENKKSTIAGHNVSWQFKNGLPWRSGYDLPKISKRGHLYGVDFSFLKEVDVFDSMDEAFERYDHSVHKRYFNGREQKVLRCEHIEEDFSILRPDWLPKLGSNVRNVYDEYLKTGNNHLLHTISLYNSCDTLVESIITKIFLHCMSCDGSHMGLISSSNKCSHIPDKFYIESNLTWKKIISSKLLPVKYA